MHLDVGFSTETELKQFQDLLYEKSGQGVSFTGLLEAMANEVTIVTAVHNIKSNKGSKTAGVIVAACSREKIIIAGDTQLNDDNGPLPFTGMKVVPVGNTMVAGLAGDYEGYRKVADYFSSKPELHFLSFQDKAEAICSLLHHSGVKCNFVLVGFENNVPQIVCTGTDYGYRYHIEQVNNGTVRTLLPPDVTDEMCRRFFTSIYGLKIQTVNCIRGVSRISQSVNDKICGFEITPHSLKCFTDGIKYEDISVRIIPVNP